MGDEIKTVDKRDKLRVVTDNSVITASALPKLSLNARKLLYLAIAQCRKNDAVFSKYEISVSDLAEMWGIDRSNVYREADRITDELMDIKIDQRSGKRSFRKKHLFAECAYNEDSMVVFELHKDMVDLLLGLRKDFSQPLLFDFMKMRSPYSMAIWHLMQREMKSFKPKISAPIEFDLTLEELRKVTGCENKFRSLSEFKRFVLDKALVEIVRNCWTDISYTNIKRSRTVVGFRFTARSVFDVDIEKMPYRLQKRVRKADLVRREADGIITLEEKRELEELRKDLEQMTLEDYANHYPID